MSLALAQPMSTLYLISIYLWPSVAILQTENTNQSWNQVSIGTRLIAFCCTAALRGMRRCVHSWGRTSHFTSGEGKLAHPRARANQVWTWKLGIDWADVPVPITQRSSGELYHLGADVDHRPDRERVMKSIMSSPVVLPPALSSILDTVIVQLL